MLAGETDHVFVDCGPVGFAGRGGHGHNDCLSFEATLDGTRLVADAGSFVYTASPEWRNRFRSTAFHNTPRVDGEELNRIPESLWQLGNDALPEPIAFEERGETVLFRGSHTGYLRLPDPVRPVRTIALERSLHALLVDDVLEAREAHRVEIPLLLAPGVTPALIGDTVTLTTGGRAYKLVWEGADGVACELESGWVSLRYGVKLATKRLVWRFTGTGAWLSITIAPVGADGAVSAWRREILEP